MRIILARVYGKPQPQGYRVLVDRLWPRGLSRQAAALDDWNKTLAPTPQLRTWFGHEPAKWPEFSRRYRAELSGHGQEAKALLARARPGPLVLLYAARDEQHAHPRVLKAFLETL